jgi:hypothetical protein
MLLWSGFGDEAINPPTVETIYTHLVNWESDEFISKVAKIVKEAQELVESGFDYVCDVEGYNVFRKRK